MANKIDEKSEPDASLEALNGESEHGHLEDLPQIYDDNEQRTSSEEAAIEETTLVSIGNIKKPLWERILSLELDLNTPVINCIKYVRDKIVRPFLGPQYTGEIEKQLRINRKDLPNLLDDIIDDFRLKTSILADLNTHVSIKLPLYENINRIGKFAFAYNVDADNLINFFRDPIIARLIIINTIEGSTKDPEAKGQQLKKVDRKLEIKLFENIKSFISLYNPGNTRYTISKFLEKLTEKYPKHNLREWFSNNVDTFVNDKIIASESQKIVPKVVYQSYLESGKKEPRKYIKQHLKYILNIEANLPIQKKKANEIINTQASILTLDLNWLEDQFYEDLEKISSEEFSLLEIKEMLIELMKEKVAVFDSNIDIMVVRFNNIEKTVIDNISSNDQVIEELKQQIDSSINPKFKNQGLLSLKIAKRSIPPEIQNQYRRFFDKKTTIKGRRYSEHYYTQIKSMFQVIKKVQNEQVEKESIKKIESLLSEIFIHVNKHIRKFHTSLEINDVAVFDEVENENNYAELVKIAATNQNPRIRYSAVLKLEMAKLIYNIRYNPRNVYQKHDARQVSVRLLQEAGGIRIEKDAKLERFQFFDYKDGKMQSINTEDQIYIGQEEDADLLTMDLLPATFGDIDVHLIADDQYKDALKTLFKGSFNINMVQDDKLKKLLASFSNALSSKRSKRARRKVAHTKQELTSYLKLTYKMVNISEANLTSFVRQNKIFHEGYFEFVSQKSEYSLITKLIRKHDIREKDITDLVRMTVVVKNEEDLSRVCQHIEDKYISFGRILKLENRGYEHIGAGNGRLNIGQNTSKSDQYKAIRYVTHFPVGSETGKDRYSTILEIRVLQLDDLAKERSKHNHASHESYVQRREIECAESIIPFELYPELYDVVEDPRDLFRRTTIQLY